MLLEDHDIPNVALCTFFRVGSRNPSGFVLSCVRIAHAATGVSPSADSARDKKIPKKVLTSDSDGFIVRPGSKRLNLNRTEESLEPKDGQLRKAPSKVPEAEGHRRELKVPEGRGKGRSLGAHFVFVLPLAFSDRFQPQPISCPSLSKALMALNCG